MIDTDLLGITLNTEYVKERGLALVRTQDAVEKVENAIKAKFGDDFDVTSETHAGRIVQAGAMVLSRTLGRNAWIYAQADPRYATGEYLDAIGSLFGVTRVAATSVSCSCYFYGDVSVSIPQGSTCFDEDGNEYAVDADVSISAVGYSTGSISRSDTGAKTFGEKFTVGTNPSGVTIAGWNGLTVNGAVSEGREAESDASFRKRIVARMSQRDNFVACAYDEIMALSGVKSCFIFENPRSIPAYVKQDKTVTYEYPLGIAESWGSSNTYYRGDVVYYSTNTKFYVCTAETATVGSFVSSEWTEDVPYTAVQPHSVFVCVDEDGLDNQIAKILYETKHAGCGMTPAFLSSSQTPDYHIPVDATKASAYVRKITYAPSDVDQTYEMTFNLPENVRFYVEITVNRHNYKGIDIKGDVLKAVNKWAANEVPFVDGLSVGMSVYPFEIGNAVSDVMPEIKIVDVKVGTNKSIRSDGLWHVDEEECISVKPILRAVLGSSSGVVLGADVIVNVVS